MSETSVSSWQRRLIPVMVGMVVAAAIFFALISVREFERLQVLLEPPKAAAERILDDFDKMGAASFQQKMAVSDRKVSFVLEQQSIDRRYQQAHALILGRLWTRFMAFTTGTLMALIGAAFILGKMRESASQLQGGGQGLTVSLTSTSPGIVLSVLGTILIVAALFASGEVHTTDPPSYRDTNVDITGDVGADTNAPTAEAPAAPAPETDENAPPPDKIELLSPPKGVAGR